MKRLLLVDMSYQSYRASAANPNLTSDGRFTGGLYGFFSTLGKMVRESNATALVVGMDMKPYLRSSEFPDYKMIRKKAQDPELVARHKATMEQLHEVLPKLGVPMWGVPGFEFDDLVGHAVRKYRHRYEAIMAASNDSDLFQLLNAQNFYIVASDWKDAWTAKRVMDKHGLTPDEYMLATALTGTHNDLPGIHRVGEGKAFAAVKEPGKLRALMDQHRAIVERNLKLIKLPHAEFPWAERIPMATQAFDARAMYRALGKYDIDVTMSMSNALERTLP